MIANFADLGQKVLFVQMRVDLIGGFMSAWPIIRRKRIASPTA